MGLIIIGSDWMEAVIGAIFFTSTRLNILVLALLFLGILSVPLVDAVIGAIVFTSMP